MRSLKSIRQQATAIYSSWTAHVRLALVLNGADLADPQSSFAFASRAFDRGDVWSQYIPLSSCVFLMKLFSI